MKSSIGRRSYEPPRSRDLSVPKTTGQQLMGVCKPGNIPYYSCVAGPAHPVADCYAGSNGDNSLCESGGYHTDASCNVGKNATTVCKSGYRQQ